MGSVLNTMASSAYQSSTCAATFIEKSCIVDMQGFQWRGCGTKFLCKELAIKPLNYNAAVKQYIFNYNFAIDDLSVNVRKQIEYLTNNIHGLRFESNSEFAYVHNYSDLGKILDEQIVKKGFTMVYVKGSQKYNLLKEKLPPAVTICDLDNLLLPPLNLKELCSKNEMPFMRYCCCHETLQFQMRQCAIDNVNVLYEWLLWNYQPQ